MGSAPLPLLCNGSVNTLEQWRLCFLGVRAKELVLKTNGAAVQLSKVKLNEVK
jgi:hypothetical protein